jgi:hypothetical protein
MPPRREDQIHDVKIYTKNGVEYVEAASGGISMFNLPSLSFGNRWWKLTKGTKIPNGLRISRDAGINKATGQIHYTIRPLYDMPLRIFIALLEQLAAHAVPMFKVKTKQVKQHGTR